MDVLKRDRRHDLITRYGAQLIALLAIASSITGIRNRFAYDDVAIIVEDARFHSLQNLWHVFTSTYWPARYGGGLYRPLTTLALSVQWIAGGGSPFLFHLVNIFLYTAVCVAVFQLARQVFDDTAAIVGAAIFAVHPLHVEAVANVVGQAELGVALLLVIAVTKYIRWRREGSIGPRQIAALSAMYLCALMFKEHAIVLPALLVTSELLPGTAHETMGQRARRLAPLMVSLGIAAAIFVVCRAAVIGTVTGDHEVSVLAGQPLSVRIFTMLPVVLEWIRLFVWPASLSADYSAPRIATLTSFNATMVPAVAVIVATLLIAARSRKDHTRATFAFAWSSITLLIPSNILVVTGFVLAERTLFLPSVGVSLLLGAAIVVLARSTSQQMGRVLIYAVSLLVIAGIAQSAARNPVWYNDETLFRQTADDVPYSSKAHEMLGDLLLNQGNKEGMIEMDLGVRLSGPGDADARHFAARALHRARMQDAALPLYQQALALDPSNPQIRQEESYCLAQLGRINEAIAVARDGLKLTPGDPGLLQFLAVAATASEPATPVVVASK